MKVLLNRSKLQKIQSTSPNCNIFVRKLKLADHIKKKFTRIDMVSISRPDVETGKVLKICHSRDLFDLFSDHDFE